MAQSCEARMKAGRRKLRQQRPQDTAAEEGRRGNRETVEIILQDLQSLRLKKDDISDKKVERTTPDG